jgi:hypothetical protein
MFYMRFAAVLTLALGLCAQAQTTPDSEVVHPNQRATVDKLPHLVAEGSGTSAAAKTLVDIVLGVKTRCDSGSQVESAIESVSGDSLRGLINKIDGTTCSNSGQLHKVNASFTPNGAIKANDVIVSLLQGKPLLMGWKNVSYVLYGVVYDQHLFYSGRQDNVIREFLLIDPRYGDKRRTVTFVVAGNDFGEVEGIASISVN